MIALRVASQGILTTALSREFPDAPVLSSRNMRSFDLKAIRKRVAFGAQDDRI